MTAFNEHCNAIVKDYVQTVLIIDDQAGLGLNKTFDMEQVKVPVSNNPLLETENKSQLLEVAEQNEKPKVESHQLDALKLTNAFYEKGIVAGLYQPQITNDDINDFATKAGKVAATADIIILDWMLKGSDDSYSKAIVKKILESDRESGGRIRNIIIYTGEINLIKLRDSLEVELNNEKVESLGEFQLSAQNLKISFYNKPDSGGRREREIAEEELPQKALEEFEALVNGLVPTFAMKAAATIRHNTGRILTRFDSNLDTAYLAHRALLPKVEDSEVFMLENFVSYLRNILAINKVDKTTLDRTAIEKWVDDKCESISKEFIVKKNPYTLTNDDFKKLITKGFLSDIGVVLEKYVSPRDTQKFIESKKSILSLTSLLNIIGSPKSVDDHSKNLSILTSFRRTFEDLLIDIELPYLTQGTVVYSFDMGCFLLCVTPKCDTARIDDSRMFSFTKLTRLSKGKQFDLVLPVMSSLEEIINSSLKADEKVLLEQLGYDPNQEDIPEKDRHRDREKDLANIRKYFYSGKVFVKSESSFFDLVHVEFMSDLTNRVMPIKAEDGTLEYKSTDNSKYVWIGDLEDLDTQNRVSNLVGNLNRIGTNEVEWLRRQYQ
tara:strand:- start:952 stop:2772 length:1821 start_codon:yes stop_codon:yes gene_type:complete